MYEFCDSFSGCSSPEKSALVIYNKTKTWEFTNDPEVGGYVTKLPKHKDTRLVYNDGYCSGCYLEGKKTKSGFQEGYFYENEEVYGTWYANKV